MQYPLELLNPSELEDALSTDCDDRTDRDWHLIELAAERWLSANVMKAPSLCDCERSHNGLGLAGRDCDCPAGANPPPADAERGHENTAQPNGEVNMSEKAPRDDEGALMNPLPDTSLDLIDGIAFILTIVTIVIVFWRLRGL